MLSSKAVLIAKAYSACLSAPFPHPVRHPPLAQVTFSTVKHQALEKLDVAQEARPMTWVSLSLQEKCRCSGSESILGPSEHVLHASTRWVVCRPSWTSCCSLSHTKDPPPSDYGSSGLPIFFLQIPADPTDSLFY